MITEDLRQSVAALDIKPRGDVWTSLTYCVLDAVWSIGAKYDSVVVPLVRRVAAAHGDSRPTAPTRDLGGDPFPLDHFLAAYPDPSALVPLTNAQRTSTRNGILKADAALRYATVLCSHGLTTRLDAHRMLSTPADVALVDRDLARVPGDGVRRGYLWMLAGSDENIKPDRMVLGFLSRHGGPSDPAEARLLLRDLAANLTTPERPITPWMVDHAIWLAERNHRTSRRQRAGTR